LDLQSRQDESADESIIVQAEDAPPHPRLRLHKAFKSRYLPDNRDVVVYVPPGYDEESERTRLARMEVERRDRPSDDQLLYAPYGAAYPLSSWRANSRFDGRGRFDGHGHGSRPHPAPHKSGHAGSMIICFPTG